MICGKEVLFSSTNHSDNSSYLPRESLLWQSKILPGEKENEDVKQAELKGDSRHEERDK